MNSAMGVAVETKTQNNFLTKLNCEQKCLGEKI